MGEGGGAPVVRKSAGRHSIYSRKLLIVPLAVTVIIVVLLCAAGWQGTGQRQERPTPTTMAGDWWLFLPLVQKPECERPTPTVPRATPTGQWEIH